MDTLRKSLKSKPKMKPKTKTLCSYYGGSTLYNLTTPTSDLDERGLFMHTDSAYILGTKRFDEERKQDESTDKVYKELSHYCSLLRKSNSEAMELLFCNDEALLTTSPEFELLRKNRSSFVDSKNLFSCLRGYMKGELNLAMGNRKGKLGGKRADAVTEYGFSPKNFVQLFRLAMVGRLFFEADTYYVDTAEMPGNTHLFLMSVKTEPELYTKTELEKMAASYEEKLVYAFENRAKDYRFDEDKLNELLLQLYYPVLTQNYNQQLGLS